MSEPHLASSIIHSVCLDHKLRIPYVTLPFKFAVLSEINYHTDTESSCLQIVQYLCLLISRKPIECLKFYYDLIVSKKICYIFFS